MPDSFQTMSDSPTAPSRAPFAISPSDSAALPRLPKAIFVGTGGDVTLRGVNSSADVVLRNVASGQVLDIRASHVRATGTTAADLIGLA